MPGGEPGRSLYQDVALLLQKLVLAAKARQLLTLGRGQALLAGQRLARITRVLRYPVRDGLRGAAKLPCQLRRRLAQAGQLDDLLSELRRIRRL